MAGKKGRKGSKKRKKQLQNFVRKYLFYIIMAASLLTIVAWEFNYDLSPAIKQVQDHLELPALPGKPVPLGNTGLKPKEIRKTLPDYSGQAYIEVNDNVPFFTKEELSTTPFKFFSPVDYLGRCQTAYINACSELLPNTERESLSDVTPTGWKNKNYDFIDNGGWVYNRCHLVAFCLSGEQDNPYNLITGTRYMNIEGMLPFETKVANYVKKEGRHVLYRVTPVFSDACLLADGVLMEGYSVEDEGASICFCIYAYNVQPGVKIDYHTGENWKE